MATQREGGISWTDETWNPVSGCSKVSQGCKNCYAERVFSRPYPGRAFTDVRTHPDRLDQPLRWKKPRRIFVNSMSDLFHEKVSADFIREVFGVMALASHHTFQILTKRPDRMLGLMAGHLDGGAEPAFGDWPLPNVWLGVSFENQETADKRIRLLRQTPAAVRFVSYEPALGPVDFEHDTEVGILSYLRVFENCPRIDWVIAGGESGPNARPAHPQWFRDVRDQCQAAGVPFFFKQWGEWAPGIGDVGVFVDPLDPGHFHPRAFGRGCVKLDDKGYIAVRVGKKAAGALLDGREWKEFPKRDLSMQPLTSDHHPASVALEE